MPDLDIKTAHPLTVLVRLGKGVLSFTCILSSASKAEGKRGFRTSC